MNKLKWFWRRYKAMEAGEILARCVEKWRSLFWRSDLRMAEGEWVGMVLGAVNFPKLPNFRAEGGGAVVREARGILQGRWLVFGGEIFETTVPPEWGSGCGMGREFDKRQVWEINRGSHAVKLAQAYFLTGEEVFADAALGLWEDWVERMSVGEGLVWENPMESGLRLISLTWMDALLEAGGVDRVWEERRRALEVTVRMHFWWTQRHLSFGSSANNHLIGELAALVIAGRRWPELALGDVTSRLQDEIMRQFHGDGGNREQALHYHWFAWTYAWLALAGLEGVRPEVEERLVRGAGYYASLAEAEEPWDFGDSDDASILPLAWDGRREVGDWLCWYGGRDSGAGYWLGTFPCPVGDMRSGEWKIFEESGQAVCRVGRWKARFDGSHFGYLGIAAHAHVDALHVSLWHGTKGVLIDPGTGNYRSGDGLRVGLAGAQAHNGPRPCELPEWPRRDGVFLWSGRHEEPSLRREGGALEGRWRFGRMEFVRGVRFDVEENSWHIRDVRGGGEGAWESVWCFAPEWRVEKDGWSLNLSRDELRLKMVFSPERGGELTCEKGWCSPRFGVSSETFLARWRGMSDVVLVKLFEV